MQYLQKLICRGNTRSFEKEDKYEQNHRMETLKKSVAFSFWKKFDEHHTVVRFATSWSTGENDLRSLKEILSA